MKPQLRHSSSVLESCWVVVRGRDINLCCRPGNSSVHPTSCQTPSCRTSHSPWARWWYRKTQRTNPSNRCLSLFLAWGRTNHESWAQSSTRIYYRQSASQSARQPDPASQTARPSQTPPASQPAMKPDKQTDRQADRQTHKQTDRRTDGRTDGIER